MKYSGPRQYLTLPTIALCLFLPHRLTAQAQIEPVPSVKPSSYQLEQINRKYGMFIHFGINTFHDEEWTDGTKPASSYQPKSVDTDQWVSVAKDAGMKYVILVAKHHDGFCLWDSKYTNYDVGRSGNAVNVVESLAMSCKKYGIQLGLYYSLWDRRENADTKDSLLDNRYNQYMITQISELLSIAQRYTPVVEFWFDGGWEKKNYRWPIREIYQTIKSVAPQCQVGINWTIGQPENDDSHLITPDKQKSGYPIRYFPSDFRLGDPYLPVVPDPKTFSHAGKIYYMPWESTVCISGKWFYNTKDTTFKTVSELEKLYRISTDQDNILILNCPPNREGRIRDRDIMLLTELKESMGL